MSTVPSALALALALAGLGCQNSASDKFSTASTGSPTRSPGGSQATSTASPASGSGTEPAPKPREPVPSLPNPLPGKRTNLTTAIGPAWRVALADLDGNGKRELVAIDSKAIRVLDAAGKEIATAPVTAGIQTLVVADLDGDKHDELYAGWGQTRDFMNAKARVTALHLDKKMLAEETVFAPETERPEITAIVPMLDQKSLLVGYFDSKYMVGTAKLAKSAQGWTRSNIASLRTAPSYAYGDVDGDNTPDILVGRVYGDDRGVDGDAFILAPGGKRTPIPSTRGLRSLALADADGDGHLDVFMGDGWHQNYGQIARGLLSWSRHGAAGFTTELVEDTPGQYEVMKILPAHIDGKLALVTQGSHYVRVFVRDGERWKGTTIAGAARDIAVGDVDGKPGDEVLITSETSSELVDLAGALGAT
jgi:hypothetical protein